MTKMIPGASHNNVRQKGRLALGLIMVGLDRGGNRIRDSPSGWLNGRALDF